MLHSIPIDSCSNFSRYVNKLKPYLNTKKKKFNIYVYMCEMCE